MPNIKLHQHMLHLNFLEQMYLQGYSNDDDFWKADAHQSFPSLNNGHMDEAEAHQLPRAECSFYSVEMSCTASYE